MAQINEPKDNNGNGNGHQQGAENLETYEPLDHERWVKTDEDGYRQVVFNDELPEELKREDDEDELND